MTAKKPPCYGFARICLRFEIIISVTERILAAPQTILSAANDFVRNGKESIRDGRDRGRHIDDHWWDGENRLAGGFHSRCNGNDVREVIGDCRRNGNHYR